MKYKSGEEILEGDKVLFHGGSGEIDFVVDRITGHPAMDWYVNEFGPSAMVPEPMFFGRALLNQTEDSEDLQIVSRGKISTGK
jgi:hypothetical protein